MSAEVLEGKVLVTPDKGDVSTLLVRPSDARWLLILGHGASTDMRHRTLQTIAERCAENGIATFRYNFPYMERGGGRDSLAVSLATVRASVRQAQEVAGELPLLAGGHSFGGRMTSLVAAEAPLPGVRGLVFFAFPLGKPGKQADERAAPLQRVSTPMLFLSGTRDDLAPLDLLRPVTDGLGKRATLHLLDTADHGYRVLKRSRKTAEDVFVEIVRVLRGWADALP
jgi:predicted alpha/beta-hydrolase family hydrolase